LDSALARPSYAASTIQDDDVPTDAMWSITPDPNARAIDCVREEEEE
jgi:hypothetical protein